MYWRRHEDVFSVTFFCFQDVLKTSWRHNCKTLANMSWRHLGRRLQEVLEDEKRYAEDVLKSWRRLGKQEMFAGLSKEIGKWVLLMWGLRTLWWAIITDETIKLKICIPLWPTVALLQQQKNGIMCHFFWNQSKNFDPSTLVHNSSTFVCDSSTFAYTGPHWSSDSYAFLEQTD